LRSANWEIYLWRSSCFRPPSRAQTNLLRSQIHSPNPAWPAPIQFGAVRSPPARPKARPPTSTRIRPREFINAQPKKLRRTAAPDLAARKKGEVSAYLGRSTTTPFAMVELAHQDVVPQSVYGRRRLPSQNELIAQKTSSCFPSAPTGSRGKPLIVDAPTYTA